MSKPLSYPAEIGLTVMSLPLWILLGILALAALSILIQWGHDLLPVLAHQIVGGSWTWVY